MSRQNISSGTHWEKMAGYSRAVRVGNHVYVAGTTATADDGSLVGADDATEQARFIFAKIERALVQAGASLKDVVRTRVYLTRIADWEGVARLHGEIFGEIRPVNTLLAVAALVGEQYLVEIEVDAVIGAGDAL